MPHTITTTIDLLRHGEPVGGKRYRGQTDDPLSEKGWGQMRAAVKDHDYWDIIVSSTLHRCSDFAHELAKRHNLPVQLDDRLCEIEFGLWEGRTAEELMQEDPNQLLKFWMDPLNNRPPEAEPLKTFSDRVAGAWEDIIQTHFGKHILIVGHAGVIRMVMSRVLGMPLENLFRIQVPNAGATRIRVDSDGQNSLPQLIFHAGTL